jgi:hypothetical protein
MQTLQELGAPRAAAVDTLIEAYRKVANEAQKASKGKDKHAAELVTAHTQAQSIRASVLAGV